MKVGALLTRYIRGGYSLLFCRPPRGCRTRGAGTRILRPRNVLAPRHIDIGAKTLILGHSWIEPIPSYCDQTFSPTITIGNGVYIGRHVYITAIDRVMIGDGCVLSEHVYIADSAHGFDPNGGPIMYQPLSSKGPVVIEANTFIGYRAVIAPGVTLGRHCVVGAQSVVTRSFPAYSMVAGAPARLIKTFIPELGRWVEQSP